MTQQSFPSFHDVFYFNVGHFFTPASLQELTGQQQTTPDESEFDFPPDDGVAFSSSEFREEAADFPADPAGSGQDAAGAFQSAAGGKQTLFEGYNDPGKQFGGHTRSYHRDARYSCTMILGLIAIMTLLILNRRPSLWSQASGGAPPPPPLRSQQAPVGAAVPPVSGRPAQDVPPGPHHRGGADGRGHRESQAEQEKREQTAQTDGESLRSEKKKKKIKLDLVAFPLRRFSLVCPPPPSLS